MTKHKKLIYIFFIIIICCTSMAYIDGVLKLDYIYKSLIKLILFVSLPTLYSIKDKKFYLTKIIKIKKKGILKAILLGVIIYISILSSFLLFRNFFDLSNIVPSLNKNIGVNSNNFLLVSIHISLVNSFLEEFFFRGFTFYSLKKYTTRSIAYLFSSLSFTLYHIAMMIGWFNISIFLLIMIGLFIGGLIFNYLNEKNANIYTSWMVHMFANFAINTIGFILMGVITL